MNINNDMSSLTDCAAYIPCYKDGNSVMAVMKDGQTVILNISIKCLIKNLLREKNIDIHALRRNFSGSIERKNLIPLPLGIDCVLIPVKVRKAIGVNDGSFGYISLSYIKGVSKDKNAIVTLTCGMDIECLESAKTINVRINMASIINERFSSRLLREGTLKESLPVISSEYERTATRGDIILLTYEIIKLAKRIEREGLLGRIGGGDHGKA